MKAEELIQHAKAVAKKSKKRSKSLLSRVRKSLDPDHQYTTKVQQDRKSKSKRRKSKHKVDHLKNY